MLDIDNTIKIEYVNEVKCKVIARREIMIDIRQQFSFYVEGYKYTPLYKTGKWDGKISMIDGKGMFYNGLLIDLIKHCKDRGLKIEIPDIKKFSHENSEEIESVVENMREYFVYEPYDYQIKSVKQALTKKKLLILSPTSSGKSSIIYFLYRYCVDNNIKMLITVPSTNLCDQLYSDFESYTKDNHEVSKHVSKVYSGQDKTNLKNIVISTWQSCSGMDSEFFKDIGFYVCDEAHQAKSTELSKIIDNLVTCKYRIGLTGTLNGSNIHELEMRARFGNIFKMVTTRQLIDRGIITDIRINMLKVVRDSKVVDKFHAFVKGDYQREIDYLINDDDRNEMLKNLALTLDNTTLMLFNRVEEHGHSLYDDLVARSMQNHKVVYYIHGKIKAKEREEIRAKLDGDLPVFYDIVTEDGNKITILKSKELNVGDTINITDCDYYSQNGQVNNLKIKSIIEVIGSYILLASFGTLAVGVNIRNLHNLIFCHPYKGKIINLQSIGRILRKSNSKNMVYLYDVIDDFTKGKKTNHTYKHAVNRMEIYEQEQFEYEIRKINI